MLEIGVNITGETAGGNSLEMARLQILDKNKITHGILNRDFQWENESI